MKIFELLGNLTKYIAEGFARIFSPDSDDYPEVGVQPFEGDTYQEGTDKQ